MIILITGVPGSGKTSSLVSMLMSDKSLTEYKDKDEQIKSRPIFINGISELQLDHQPLFDEQITQQPFQDWLPYGSLVVIDEAQRLFGTRPASVKVPEYIQALALHRHHGLDIILLTQHPSFLDSFVRKLVQRHMHISIKPIGRKLYEWNECVDNPDSPGQIARAIERQFNLPKKAFQMYKSAEVHTKPKRRLPKSIFIVLALLIFVVFLGFVITGRMKERFSGTEQVQHETTSEGQEFQQSQNVQNTNIGETLTPQMFVPSISEKPESKPLYNGVRQVVAFEYPVGCVKSAKNGCRCYSEQGTLLKEVTEPFCNDYIENGHFNPYKKTETAYNSNGSNSTQSTPGNVN